MKDISTSLFSISQLWVRLLGTGLSLTALLFFICPLFLGIRHAGCYAGMIISILGILFFGLHQHTVYVLNHIWENSVGHVILCVFLGILGIGVILGAVCSVLMIRAANDKPKAEHTVVILGCKVRNGAPSLMLQKRLDTAIVYLKEHPDVPVIVCGGQGADESISEAECMCQYLTAHEIAENRIYQDTTSTSTQENLQNAKAIIDQHDWLHDIIIVTDSYHQFRAATIAHSLGLDTDAVSARTSWYLLPSYWVREWLGIAYQFVFG